MIIESCAVLKEMFGELAKIDKKIPDEIVKAEASIECINTHWNTIALELKTFAFKFPDDEYYFFKFIKPAIQSKLFYHTDLYYIITRRPDGSKKILRKYFKDHQKQIYLHQRRHPSIYHYYNSKAHDYDDKYFTRNTRIKYDDEGKLLKAPNEISTQYDMLFSRIIANELLNGYLEKELMKLEIKTEVTPEQLKFNPEQAILLNNSLPWTGSKADLVELIYGLYAKKVFKNGEADIKEIASFFEKAFAIDLGDYYRTYYQMVQRKKNKAKFIDGLKESLIAKLEEEGDL